MARPLRTISSAVVTILAGLVVAACEERPSAVTPANAKPAGPEIAFSRNDLAAPASVSKLERQSFADVCVPKVRSTRLNMQGAGRVTGEQLRDMKSALDRLAPQICECLATAIEDRGNRLQFLMAITALEKGSIKEDMQIPEYPALKTAAMKAGMSDACLSP